MAPLKNARRERLAQLLFNKPTGKSDAKCYLEAGYKASTIETAATLVSRMLKNDNDLTDRIKELRKEMAEITLLDTEKVIEAITPIATSNIMDFITRTSRGWYTLRSHEELERMDTRAIKDFKMSTRIIKKAVDEEDDEIVEQIVEIKLWDKNKTADMLLRWTGGYEKDNSQKQVIIVAPEVPEDDD